MIIIEGDIKQPDKKLGALNNFVLCVTGEWR